MNNETKKEETNLDAIQRINTDLLLQNIPVDELLGSVTTYTEGNDKNQALRSSARVFKKIKLDANLLSAANTQEKTVPDKKEEQKPDQTVHKDPRKPNFSWITEEITALFFEALNENGKDFESIHTYITQKLKKKGGTEQFTKDHVRHIYNRTWHKISKYLKFSDGIKRSVQELYGLINYGELRKKVPSTQKIYFKLNDLVHHGCVTLRVKGKMARVRTPMCPALRRINKLDDKEDDLKLPPRVVVQLQPKNMQAFLKVQSFALNPRVKTELPLQKKLSTFINCVSRRWKAAEIEYLKNNYPKEELLNGESDDGGLDIEARLITSQLKFSPPKGAKLNLLRTEVCDFITRENICLKAYEERMGIDGSKLNDKNNCKKSSQKARNDSFSESTAKLPVKLEVEQQVQDALNISENASTFIDFSCLLKLENLDPTIVQEDCVPKKETDEFRESNEDHSDHHGTNKTPKSVRFKVESDVESPAHVPLDKSPSIVEENSDNNNKDNNKNISVEDQLRKLAEVRNGWTIDDCDNLTIGELYLMFGSASKLILEYHWVNKEVKTSTDQGEASVIENDAKSNESEEKMLTNFEFSDTLRKLVDVMKMQQNKVVQKCSCGHVCSPKNTATKKNHAKIMETEEKSGVDDAAEMESLLNSTKSEDSKTKTPQFEDFVKPQCKQPPVHLIAQLDSIEKLKPKYSIRKGRRLRAKQLVVERELPLTPKSSSGHQIVCMNIISNKVTNSEDNSTIVDNEDQWVDAPAPPTGATQECDNRNSFQQVLYMEENCNHYTDNMGGRLQLGINEETPTMCRSNHLEDFLDTARSLSPTVILKENENQWISSDVADFSLSSFLGHLESPMKTNDDISNDVDCQLRSLMTENSFDYTAKFADLANKVVGDTAN